MTVKKGNEALKKMGIDENTPNYLLILSFLFPVLILILPQFRKIRNIGIAIFSLLIGFAFMIGVPLGFYSTIKSFNAEGVSQLKFYVDLVSLSVFGISSLFLFRNAIGYLKGNMTISKVLIPIVIVIFSFIILSQIDPGS